MDDRLLFTFYLLAIISAIVFFKLRELFRLKRTKKLVAWAVLGDYDAIVGPKSYTQALWSDIKNAQYTFKLSKEYSIIEENDVILCHDIIREYQNHMAKRYFLDTLPNYQTKKRLSSKDYFMATLYDFLSDHQCDHEFIGHIMCEKRLKYIEYGTWGVTNYDATYALSDFAIIYHKLLYITFCYCKNCLAFNPEKDSTWRETRENSLKNAITKKQLDVFVAT